MNALPDINIDAIITLTDKAANSGPAPLGNEASTGDASMAPWPWWTHGVARKMATLIQDQGYTMLAALKRRPVESTHPNRWSIFAMEMMASDERTHLPRPSHFLEASQKLMTSLNRHGDPETNPEPGLKDPTIWVTRLCQSDAEMSKLEIRLNGSVVGRQLSEKIQQVLWMAHRYNAHRNFREAQSCFDNERMKVVGKNHDYVLQLGLYRLIESLQQSKDEVRHSPWQVRDLADMYIGGKLGPVIPQTEVQPPPAPDPVAQDKFAIPDPPQSDDFQESVAWQNSSGWTELNDDDDLQPL